LALFCVFALGALGAQSASAAVTHSFFYDGGTNNAIITGTTEPGTSEVFKLTSISVECTDMRYRGTMFGPASDHFTVVPLYDAAGGTSCKAFGVNATITNKGCTFTYESDTSEHPNDGFGVGEEHAEISRVCGHTGSITVEAAGCTLHLSDTHRRRGDSQPEPAGHPLYPSPQSLRH
jgi:hypothetical protein